MVSARLLSLAILSLMFADSNVFSQSTLDLQLRFQNQVKTGDNVNYATGTRDEQWDSARTAIIVCDVWDYHHCLNAVRRIEQFAPRLDQVLTEARKRGVTVIHSPSDCMEAYQTHPARKRAVAAPEATHAPYDIGDWCSMIPAEERADYPIDQSDGGEDDDPAEHAQWVKKLRSLGRNPNLPWKRQTDLLTIDPDVDYISDRGDEVWNILEAKQINNVILVGVHTNMCVLGRPFGLRQMARNGKNVVLMRDMTDTMYNPKRWPFVSHFEGTRRIISHVERYVCPTISSDQIIDGEPFQFEGDSGENEKVSSSPDFQTRWTTVPVPLPEGMLAKLKSPQWYRCVVRIPKYWLDASAMLRCDDPELTQAWLNGYALKPTVADDLRSFHIPNDQIEADDANLLVVKLPQGSLRSAPVLHVGNHVLPLVGQWQLRVGNDSTFRNMPLPAKFGAGSDIVFSPQERLWTPRVVTRPGEFTEGIEGPACDRDGNIFAVNFSRQGTIGRVTPDGRGEVFVELPEGSIGNGIRFAPDGTFFVADYAKHNILRVDPKSHKVTVHAHQGTMNQPNDLAIAPDGKTLYASDPNWDEGTGNLWRIDDDGTVTKLTGDMGTTNGIEVSPNGETLYVNESVQRNIWAFPINKDRTLGKKRLVRKFQDHGFDGMRCDVDGNLYVTRYGKGTVVKLTPDGKVLREIPVLGTRPSNLCFGGPDKRTVYVTEVESARLVSFRVDQPGRP